MEFNDEVTFEFTKDHIKSWVQKRYPEPYYQIKNFKAKAMYGNYAKDIFEIIKSTHLEPNGIIERKTTSNNVY